MTTIKISDGDIAINEDTGIVETVSDIEEAAQNVARHILSEYNSFFDEGNELINYSFQNSPNNLTDMLVDQYITEAINRLIIKQQELNTVSRILKINQIKTRVVGLSTVVFLVEVLFESGDIINVVDRINVKPTSLNHLLDPSAFLGV